jgi:hypothetical protein
MGKKKKAVPLSSEWTEKDFPVLIEKEDRCALLDEQWDNGLYGAYDVSKSACQECDAEFADVAEICKFNTSIINKIAEVEKAPEVPEVPETPAPKATKKKKGKEDKPVIVTPTPEKALTAPEKAVAIAPTGRTAATGAGKIDLLLFSDKGASMEEMLACRKGVSSHLHSLKMKGFIITQKGDRWYGSVKSAEAQAA